MKIGILTFHAAYNYGSMLQAYALQHTILSLGHKCEIINLRTTRQKNFYRPFFRTKGIIGYVKALAYPQLAWGDYRKCQLFEKFLRNYLKVTGREYKSSEELSAADFDYDVYISGSDQIWNTSCLDNDPSFFLDFVKKGKKVAYAPSMGPIAEKEVDKSIFESIRKFIADYDFVSVREEGTAKLLEKISGIKAPIVLDPTLLIPKAHWSELAGSAPLIEGRYILLYKPWYDEALYKQAAELANEFDLQVVCTIQNAYRKWKKNPRFKYAVATGPLEFLNLVKYSTLVVSGSYHAVAFSIIFEKPFFAPEGLEDNRIRPILQRTGLTDYVVVPTKDRITRNQDALISSYDDLSDIRNRSIAFLKNALHD